MHLNINQGLPSKAILVIARTMLIENLLICRIFFYCILVFRTQRVNELMFCIALESSEWKGFVNRTF